MIKLMLIAGKQVKPLNEYLSSRGTLEVSEFYDNLYTNELILSRSVTSIDRLVYLFTSDETPIRQDMATLRTLLMDNNIFFKVKHILFFVSDSSTSAQGVKFIHSVMEEADYKSYEIKQTKDSLQFIDIYNTILGNSKLNKVNNTVKKVYRVERNSKSSQVYDADNDISVIEPFTLEHLESYEESKSILSSTDNHAKILIDKEEQVIKKFDNPYLGSLTMNIINHKKNVFLVTGNARSGISTYCSMLSLSTGTMLPSVVVVSLASKFDYEYYFKKYNKPFNKIDFNGLKISDNIDGFNFIDCCEFGDDVCLDYFRKVMSFLNKFKNCFIFIDCPIEYHDFVVAGYKLNLNKIFYVSECYTSEISKLDSHLHKYSSLYGVYLLLNGITTTPLKDKIDGKAAKEYVNDSNIRVVEPIIIPNYDIDATLFNRVVVI